MRRWVWVAGAVVLVAACSAEGGAARSAPAPELDPGDVVTTESWLAGRGVSELTRAQGVASASRDEIVVLAPDGSDEEDPRAVVVSWVVDDGQHPSPAPGFEPSERVYLFAGVPCGARSLVVDVDGQLMRVASLEASDDDLAAVGERLQFDEERHLIDRAPDGWHVAGRLAPGWTHPAQGSVGLVEVSPNLSGPGSDGFVPMTISLLDDAGAAALRALRCDEPRDDLAPPITDYLPAMSSFQPRTFELRDGSTAWTGPLASLIGVAFSGDRLLSFGAPPADDDLLVRLLSEVVTVDGPTFEEGVAEVARASADRAVEAFRQAVAPGVVIADGDLGDVRWVLWSATDSRVGTQLVCIAAARGGDGNWGWYQPGSEPSGCVGDVPVQSELYVAASSHIEGGANYVSLVFCEVPANVTTAEINVSGPPPAVVVDDRGRRYVVMRLSAGLPIMEDHYPFSTELRLVPGIAEPLILTLRDQDGAVVTQDVIGTP